MICRGDFVKVNNQSLVRQLSIAEVGLAVKRKKRKEIEKTEKNSLCKASQICMHKMYGSFSVSMSSFRITVKEYIELGNFVWLDKD